MQAEDDIHYTNLPEQIVKIRMDRVWEMPNPWTFEMKYVKKLLDQELAHPSIDPFAGHSSMCTVTNDINPNLSAMFHEDALSFLERQPSNHFATAIYDPPYSNQQFRICYNEFGQEPNPQVFNAHWQSVIKDNIARILKPGGKSICCGWDTNGIGKGRGFKLNRILMVAHGRQHHDTLITVEQKLNESLLSFQ
jgi:hypothetical protein